MELHDVRSHHASKDMVTHLEFDQYGQPIAVRGRGLRLVNIYELIRDNDDVVVWFENPATREVIWKSWLVKTRSGKKRTGPYTVEQIEYLHRKAYPSRRMVIWEGGNDGSYLMWREPLLR